MARKKDPNPEPKITWEELVDAAPPTVILDAHKSVEQHLRLVYARYQAAVREIRKLRKEAATNKANIARVVDATRDILDALVEPADADNHLDTLMSQVSEALDLIDSAETTGEKR